MIKCHLHDYVEIVCMFHYPLKLTTSDNRVIECIAMDTKYNENKQECIKIKSGGVESLVILENIAELEVLVENPYFEKVIFN